MHRWSRLSATRRRIVVGLADQAVSSFGNFFVILAAVRLLDPVEVGRFTVAQLIFVTAIGIEQAMVGDILLVAGVADRQRDLARQAASAALLIGLATTAVYTPIGVLVLGQSALAALLLGLLAVPFLVQDALRYLLVSSGRAGAALGNDLAWTSSVVLLICVHAAGSDATPVKVLLLWLVPGACAALIAMVQARATLSLRAALTWLRTHRQVSRRFLVEYMSITGSFQIVVYVLAGTAGLAASGALRGATALFGPLHTVFTGAKLAVVPELARLRSAVGARKASLRISVLLGLIALVYGGVLSALPDGLGTRGLGGNFVLLAPLFPLLAMHKIADAVATGPFTVLRSQERTRRTAQGRVGVALLGIVGGVTGAVAGGAWGAELGLASASVLGCLLWRLLLTRSLAEIAEGPDADASASSPLPSGFRVLKVGRTELVALPADRAARRSGMALTRPISQREEVVLGLASFVDRLGAWRLVSRPLGVSAADRHPAHRRALARVLQGSRETQAAVVAARRPRDPSRLRSYLYLEAADGDSRFVKVVTGTAEKSAVQHEQHVLESLRDELNAPELHVPAAARLYPLDEDSSVIVTDALPVDCRPASASVLLLERLTAGYARPRTRGVPSWLTAEALSSPAAIAALRRHGLLDLAVEFGREQPDVALGRVHGDLSPANLYVSGAGWWLIDWERSLALAPVVTDVFLWPHQDVAGLIERPPTPYLTMLPRADRVAAALTAVLLREQLLVAAEYEEVADSRRETAAT